MTEKATPRFDLGEDGFGELVIWDKATGNTVFATEGRAYLEKLTDRLNAYDHLLAAHTALGELLEATRYFRAAATDSLDHYNWFEAMVEDGRDEPWVSAEGALDTAIAKARAAYRAAGGER